MLMDQFFPDCNGNILGKTWNDTNILKYILEKLLELLIPQLSRFNKKPYFLCFGNYAKKYF